MKRALTSIFMIIIIFFALVSHSQYHSSFTVEGLEANSDALNNVNATLKNIGTKIKKSKTTPNATNIAKQVDSRVKSALQPFGYFHSYVSTTIENQDDTYNITVTITKGPAIMVRNVSIQLTGAAKNDPDFQQLITDSGLTPNTQLDTKKYDKLKSNLFDLASQKGYFDAEMTKNQIIINQRAQSASILIAFDSGDRYTIQTITIDKTPYNPLFIKKYLSIKPNDYYDTQQINKSKKNLTNSNLFDNVSLQNKDKDSANHTINLNLSTQAKEKMGYLIGAGYGTDTGPRGTLGVNVNRLGKNGQQLNFLSQGSLGSLLANPDNLFNNINNSAVIKYSIPGSNPLTTKYTISTGIGHIVQTTGRSDAKKIAVTQIYSVGHLRQTTSINALDETYDISTLPYTDTTLLYPNINWYYRDADHTLNPNKGFSITINLAGTTNSLSTQHSGFFQVKALSNFLYTIKPSKTRLLLRNTIGNTTISNLNALPLSLQLFTGGSQNLRGFSYNSIGPGRNLLTSSFELQQSLFGSNFWYIAGFYDIGTVSNANVFDFNALYRDTGPGLVWLSPIGMMEISVGIPLHPYSDSAKFQFSMGAAL